MADLYLQGWLQADIASEVGVSDATVSRDLKALQDEWLASALMDFNEAKANELAKIDRLEREYWDAWERSKEDAETITTKGRGTKAEAESVEKTVQRKGQVGDSRFLDGVMRCIERRCKILGVDAPEKHDLSGSVGVFDVDDWKKKREERKREIESLECADGDGD